MPDQSFIHWPFFDHSHRQLRTELCDWMKFHDEDHDANPDEICRKWVRELGQGGWLRHCVPREWGGKSDTLDVRSLSLCRDSLAYHSGLADFSFAMQGLGSGPISLFGSAAQRQQYLPGVAAGTSIAAFALSEAAAGSDVAALETAARRENDHYVIDGEKTWISNGGIADFYCVFARSEDAPGTQGLSAFIVEAGTPGLVVADRIETMSPHPLATLRFEHCQIPASGRIGSGGEGFRIAMSTLDVFRTTVGAAALGFARRALDAAVEHSEQRNLFGAPLSELQMTQASIADMATDVDASALLVYRSAWAKDCQQDRVTREAAMAKLFATEAAQRVIDRTVQLFGGQGVTRGNIAERLYREIRALRIYEGTSEIQKIIIARQTYQDASP